MILDSKIPGGSIEEKWTKHKFELKLVNPANKRKFTVLVVGTGLAGASAAASLAELGTMLSPSAFRTLPVVLTPLLPRVVSMLLRAIRTMVTLSIVFSTIPLRAVTSALVKPTFIVSPKTPT